jgi:hypothetical protein
MMKDNIYTISIAIMLAVIISRRIFPDFARNNFVLLSVIGLMGAITFLYILVQKLNMRNKR